MLEGRSFLKREYRSEMGIIEDILAVTVDGGRQGVIGSAISRRANLSHDIMVQKCRKLMNAGLMELMKVERNMMFRVTEKGLWFFQELQRFQDVIRTMKIRC